MIYIISPYITSTRILRCTTMTLFKPPNHVKSSQVHSDFKTGENYSQTNGRRQIIFHIRKCYSLTLALLFISNNI